jgi:hypothetical protein
MREIYLGGQHGSAAGRHALVDDEDFDWLDQYNWRARKADYTYYAYSDIGAARPDRVRRDGSRRNGGRETIAMHFVITGHHGTDHVDRNGLNNQKANLRDATASQNLVNRRRYKNNTSGFIGVTYRSEPKARKWCARIGVDGVNLALGYYESREEAAEVYDQAAIGYYGEFAELNFSYGDDE